MTTLAGKLPKHHGLGAIDPQLIDTPKTRHIVMAVVDCRKVSTDMDTGEVEPTVRILRIECVLRDDYTQAEMLLRRALESRHGSTTLPFDTEQDLQELYASLDETDPDAAS
jgi:hypothetical protein